MEGKSQRVWIDKSSMKREPRLVWIDLEMTGLNPQKDQILEIATIITDNNLILIEEGPSLVIHCDESYLDAMSPEVAALHSPSGLLEKVRESNISVQQAEDETLAFIKKHCESDKSILCGNSIWTDRMFLAAYMPRIIEILHYRMIDVSSIKELVNRWYPNDPDAQFNKKETHRALADIRESIAELKHYRRYFFV